MLRNKLYLLALIIPMGCSTLPRELPPVDTGPISEERAEALLQTLLALGVDYRYGGGSPDSGFDCSGLVAHVFREAYGIELPHNARAQSEFGVRVSLSELRAGDLVFYNTQRSPFSHVGIYLGDGRFVHAPSSGKQVRVDRLDARYWQAHLSAIRRF
jgi:cell wall-associated NlpC family hydrolase